MHPGDGGRWIGQGKQGLQFPADPLARQAFKRFRQFSAGFLRFRIQIGPKARLEAEIAQDTQVILANALAGITDEPYALCGKVFEPAEIVGDLQRRGMDEQRVDGEIAPRCILAPVLCKCHGRTAAVGGYVMPQRRNLDITGISGRRHQRRNSPVVNAGGNSANARRFQPRDDLFGLQGRGSIDILHIHPHHRIAHGTANPADVVCAEGGHHRSKIFALGPRRSGKAISHGLPPHAKSAAKGWR